MVNVAYGILTNGLVTEDMPGYRYTDARCPDSAKRDVAALMGLVPESSRGVLANLLLDILRSSDQWVDYIKNIDRQNTYQTVVVAEKVYDGLSNVKFSDILAWADSVRVNPELCTKHDTAMDRICAALLTVLSK